jgi:CubicO group peptidase (beta-lactamase class C family)
MVIASISKLFSTACVLQLREQGKLGLDDKIGKYLDEAMMNKLHVYKGVEYSGSLTVSDLLFQVSGLPDCFLEGEDSYSAKLFRNEDCYVTLDGFLSTVKQLGANFAPRKPGRAYYADINFDLLGKIAENIRGEPIEQIIKHNIIDPLGLMKTYPVTNEQDEVPDIYNKNGAIIRAVKFLMCSPASGGIVSTARELMTFLKAFWSGKLFDKSIFSILDKPNRLQMSFAPITYAGGYMRLDVGLLGLPVFTKFKLIGHSGSTGSFAFYCPEKDLYFVGDANQVSNPGIPIQLLIKLAFAAK